MALSRVDSIPLRKRLSYSSVRYLRCFSCVNSVRLLRAKPEKIIVDVLGNQSEFPEQSVHLRAEGIVMLIDCGGILCAMRRFGLLRRS